MLTFIVAQIAASETAQKVVETALDSDTAKQVVQQTGLWQHILNSDPLVKLTLLLLIGFSVTCWAVIFFKITQLTQAQKSSQKFWHKFSATPRIADMLNTKTVRQGPMFEIFTTGHQTISRIKKPGGQVSSYQRSVLEQRINQTREEEIYKLEQHISFLATTASVAPFIGLFGTVWGILTAFMAIGKAGTSSLATVGPYIAEALVATAVGLFAAIPAVVAYNFFVNKINVINRMIDLFIDDFMLKSELELMA